MASIYENLTLPSTPGIGDVEHWVTGAVKLTGLQVSAELVLDRSWSTGADDGAGHPIPSYRVWELSFRFRGVPLAGAHCSLTAQSTPNTAAMLTCRIPTTRGALSFESFTATPAQAETAARSAVGAPSTARVTTNKIYLASSNPASARFTCTVFDGTKSTVVVLSGAAVVLYKYVASYDLTYNGWAGDYASNDSFEDNIDAVTDVGMGQTTHLDSADAAPGKTSCGPSDYSVGFAICNNGLADLLTPRANGDYTDIDYNRRWAGKGFAPAIEYVSTTNSQPTPAYLASTAVHHAEVQAFANIGRLQRWYNGLGVPSNNGQDPHRLQISVHKDTNNASADLNSLLLGDFRKNGNAFGFDSSVDATIYAHEYNHHVLESARVDKSWAPDPNPAFPGWICGTDQAVAKKMVCPRDALHEGLSDAFAAVYSTAVNRNRTATILDPSDLLNPCSNVNAYPNNPLGTLQRNACNSVVYNYWQTQPDVWGDIDQLQNLPYEIHRRGTVVFGAIYTFQKRLRDAGFGSSIVGTYLLKAERDLTQPADDERVFLDLLLGYLPINPNIRVHRQLAQVAFAEKGVFPNGGGASCPGCADEDALSLSQRSLAIGGPLNLAPGAAPPQFDVFAPKGSAFASTVEVQLSNRADFAMSPAGSTVTQTVTVPATAYNNSPPGFFRFTPTTPNWNTVANSSTTRVYYRVRQCLASAGGCVNSFIVGGTQATAPNVVLIHALGGSCSLTATGERSTRSVAVGFAALALLGCLARRGSRRS